MYKKFHFFTTANNVKQIFEEDDLWKDALYYHSHIHLEDENWYEDEILFWLSDSGCDIDSYDKENLIEEVLSCCSPVVVLPHAPSCLYALGVECQNSEYGTPEKLIQRGWSVDPTEPNRSWQDFFYGMTHEGNALVISDKYFFCCSANENYQKAFENLWGILVNCLPDNFVNDIFHVTIVTDIYSVDKRNTRDTFELIANMIRDLIDDLNLPYNIQVELISLEGDFWKKNELHDRHIFSNYYMVNASKNLKAFPEDYSQRESQIIDFRYIFTDYNPKSTAPIFTMSSFLYSIEEALLKTYSHNKQYALIENGQVQIYSYDANVQNSMNRMLRRWDAKD